MADMDDNETKDIPQARSKCPCCGQLVDKHDVKLDESITDQFLTCMMTGEQFSHTYSLYGGKMRVTVSRVPETLADSIEDAESVLRRLDAAGKTLRGSYGTLQLLNQLKVMACITDMSVRVGVGQRQFKPVDVAADVAAALAKWKTDMFDAQPPEDLLKAADEGLAKLTSPQLVGAVPIDILLNLVATHNRLYGLLIELSEDKNFWQGIGPA